MLQNPSKPLILIEYMGVSVLLWRSPAELTKISLFGLVSQQKNQLVGLKNQIILVQSA